MATPGTSAWKGDESPVDANASLLVGQRDLCIGVHPSSKISVDCESEHGLVLETAVGEGSEAWRAGMEVRSPTIAVANQQVTRR